MSATEVPEQAGSDNTAIRPLQVGFPEAEPAELHKRVNATRWPERETVTDDSQGVPLATMHELARYWGTDYDWGKCEAKLNALPHFRATGSRVSRPPRGGIPPASHVRGSC